MGVLMLITGEAPAIIVSIHTPCNGRFFARNRIFSTVVFAQERAILHALLAEHIAPNGILPQHARSPLSELRGTDAVHTVDNSDDSVENIELCQIIFPVRSSYRDFLGNCFFFQFSRCKYVLKMQPKLQYPVPPPRSTLAIPPQITMVRRRPACDKHQHPHHPTPNHFGTQAPRLRSTSTPPSSHPESLWYAGAPPAINIVCFYNRATSAFRQSIST